MRFVSTLTLFVLLSSPSFAAPWDVVPIANNSHKITATARPVQMQRGGSSNKLETIDELELKIIASGLGKVSAMELGDDGTLFTADAKSGRIWTLTDRGQDGKIDLRRPLPFTFKNPTGLAVMDGTLYVADQAAIWAIETGQEPRELASLQNTNSTGGPHNLSVSSNGKSLILGLTTKTQDFRILELHTQTGQASLIGEGNYGHLHSLAQRAGSGMWVASGTTLGPLGSDILEFTAGQSISSIALPGQYETPLDWPAQLGDHIITAQTGPNAMQLIAIPTEFGQVSGKPRVLVEGFLTGSNRSAWGQPGPIVMDKRGLFFADPHNGTLWRLSPTPKPKTKIATVDTASLPLAPSIEPGLTSKGGALKIESSIKGTQIDASSSIIKPSGIEYGSKLIKDYDEKKALEDAEKSETKPKKKRRMSRKRKQQEK